MQYQQHAVNFIASLDRDHTHINIIDQSGGWDWNPVDFFSTE